MDNLVVNIVLPKGLALTNGAVLDEDQTLVIVGSVSPWYSSIDLVRTEGGIYLRELGDLAIAAEIYKVSNEADTLTCVNPPALPANAQPTDTAYKEHRNFLLGRQIYVSKKAAFNCILNVFDLAGARGSKTLGNFSVTRMSFARDESMPRKMNELKKEFAEWKIVIQSAGQIGMGGSAKAGFAAKGKYNGSDRVPGRLWVTTGMGANRETIAGAGSEGKPVKYSSTPVVQWRQGRASGSYLSLLPVV